MKPPPDELLRIVTEQRKIVAEQRKTGAKQCKIIAEKCKIIAEQRKTGAEQCKIIAEQRKGIEKQSKIIDKLNKQVQELKERLGVNSTNSSKPPSTDKKKNKQAPKGGAKKGHAGHSRKLFPKEKISKRVVSPLTACHHCGGKNFKKTPSQILQQIELPNIDPVITQIECEKGKCRDCGKNLKASFPKEYHYSNFGPKLVAFIGMCSSIYRLSKRSTKELLETIFNVNISLGSVPAQERKLSKGLKPVYEELKSKIDKASVVYIDETSFRQQAQTHYVWTASSKDMSWLKILPGRSIASLNLIRPRGDPGITVSDRYQVYSYEKHQYCLAHIKRDLKKFEERSSQDRELAKRGLFELKKVFLASQLSCRKKMHRIVYYRKKRFKKFLIDTVANGSETFSRFAERLLKQFHRLFFFTKNAGIECTNNIAERSLRHIVLWRKTSYGTQSEEGSRFMERAVSVWMTLKKRKMEIFTSFIQAYQSTYHPQITSPVL